MHISRKASLLGMATLAAMGMARPAAAQTTVYDNTATFSGFVLNGFASNDAAGYPLIADDITPAAGYSGSPVTQFTFRIVNISAGTVVVTTASFYAADGANGGPGTLLGSAPLGSLTLDTGMNTFTENSTSGFFNMPQGSLWAGLSFSGQPVSTLNRLGLPIYTQPTVGSSQNSYFLGSGPASSPAASNPAGTINSVAVPFPPANFAWQLRVTPTPEPSQTASLALGAFALGGLAFKARKRNTAS